MFSNFYKKTYFQIVPTKKCISCCKIFKNKKLFENYKAQHPEICKVGMKKFSAVEEKEKNQLDKKVHQIMIFHTTILHTLFKKEFCKMKENGYLFWLQRNQILTYIN